LDWFHRLEDMAVYVDYAAIARRKPEHRHLTPLVCQDLQMVKPTLFKNRKAILEPQNDQDVDRLIAGVMAWKRQAPDPKPIWILCDEIHNYGSQWDHPSVTRLFTMGRNSNVIGVAITQNLPQVRNTAIITNCQVKVLFSLDDAAVHALRRNYSIIVPDHVLAHVNQDASMVEGTRRIYNAAVYGLAGREWILI
jgi:hypothetical protein